jgi:myo-inositol-1(or 4)-monophosphatase
MNATEKKRALQAAVSAAQAAGQLMRSHLHRPKKVNEEYQHDIKLELDVRCQKLIERTLLQHFPATAILGEEGVTGDIQSPRRWVVDPIDGTVNFTYGIPHACVSIALQERRPAGSKPARKPAGVLDDDAEYETVVGVVYDPFCNELWTAVKGGPARLNGRTIRVSPRTRLNEAVVSLGFAKTKATLGKMLPSFNRLVHQVRKIRIMGAAALAMTYVASGRFEAYVEAGVRLWDVAAGGLILECAGGDFYFYQMPGRHVYAIIANNGPLRARLRKFL